MGAEYSCCVLEDSPRRTAWLVTNDHKASPPRCLFQQCTAECVTHTANFSAQSFVNGAALSLSISLLPHTRPIDFDAAASFGTALCTAMRRYHCRLATLDLSKYPLSSWDLLTVARVLPNIRRALLEAQQASRPTFSPSLSSTVVPASAWALSRIVIDNQKSLSMSNFSAFVDALSELNSNSSAPPPSSSSSSGALSLSLSVSHTSLPPQEVNALAWRVASWLIIERDEPCRWPRGDSGASGGDDAPTSWARPAEKAIVGEGRHHAKPAASQDRVSFSSSAPSSSFSSNPPPSSSSASPDPRHACGSRYVVEQLAAPQQQSSSVKSGSSRQQECAVPPAAHPHDMMSTIADEDAFYREGSEARGVGSLGRGCAHHLSVKAALGEDCAHVELPDDSSATVTATASTATTNHRPAVEKQRESDLSHSKHKTQNFATDLPPPAQQEDHNRSVAVEKDHGAAHAEDCTVLLIQQVSARAFFLSEMTARSILGWHLGLSRWEAALQGCHVFIVGALAHCDDGGATIASLLNDAILPLKGRAAAFNQGTIAALSGKAHAWLQAVFSLVEMAEHIAFGSGGGGEATEEEAVNAFMDQMALLDLSDDELRPLVEVLTCAPRKAELMRSLAAEAQLLDMLADIPAGPRPYSPHAIAMGVVLVGRLLSSLCHGVSERDHIQPFEVSMGASLEAVMAHVKNSLLHHPSASPHADDDARTTSGEEEEEEEEEESVATEGQDLTEGNQHRDAAEGVGRRTRASPSPQQHDNDDDRHSAEPSPHIHDPTPSEEDKEHKDVPRGALCGPEANNLQSMSVQCSGGGTSRFPHYMKRLGATLQPSPTRARSPSPSAAANTFDANSLPTTPRGIVGAAPPAPPSLRALRGGEAGKGTASIAQGEARRRSDDTSSFRSVGDVEDSHADAPVVECGGNVRGSSSAFMPPEVAAVEAEGSASHQPSHDEFDDCGDVDLARCTHGVEATSQQRKTMGGAKPFDVEEDDDEGAVAMMRDNEKAPDNHRHQKASHAVPFTPIAVAEHRIGSGSAGSGSGGGGKSSGPTTPRMTAAVLARIERLKLKQEAERKAGEKREGNRRFASVEAKVSTRRSNSGEGGPFTNTTAITRRRASPTNGLPSANTKPSRTKSPLPLAAPSVSATNGTFLKKEIPSASCLPHHHDHADHSRKRSPVAAERGDVEKAAAEYLARCAKRAEWNDNTNVPVPPKREPRITAASNTIPSQNSADMMTMSAAPSIPRDATMRAVRSPSPTRLGLVSNTSINNPHHSTRTVVEGTVAKMREAHAKAHAEARQNTEGQYYFAKRDVISNAATNPSSSSTASAQQQEQVYAYLSAQLAGLKRADSNKSSNNDVNPSGGSSNAPIPLKKKEAVDPNVLSSLLFPAPTTTSPSSVSPPANTHAGTEVAPTIKAAEPQATNKLSSHAAYFASRRPVNGVLPQTSSSSCATAAPSVPAALQQPALVVQQQQRPPLAQVSVNTVATPPQAAAAKNSLVKEPQHCAVVSEAALDCITQNAVGAAMERRATSRRSGAQYFSIRPRPSLEPARVDPQPQ